MDCRRSLMPALSLLAGCVGCLGHTVTPWTSAPEATAANVQKERELPKRAPHASTCLTFGNFAERMAAEPNRNPSERDRLRDQARRAYQQALEIEPENLAAAAALAHLYITLEDPDRALAVYHKAARAHPKEVAVWFEMGMCHARKKEWEPALQNLRKAVELDPENRQVTNALAFCLARAGRYDDSLVAFQKTGTEAEAHYNLARMLRHMNQDASSRQHAQLALQLNPELTSAKQLLDELEGAATSARAASEGQTSTAAAFQPASLTDATDARVPPGGGKR
jgi:tetratricopeptide (TPR) repeat protein